MSKDNVELIAEAREWASSYASWGDSGLVDRLTDALEAATRERDATTEERIERLMQLVGKGVEKRLAAEAERDELQAKLEDVEGLSRALANGASISRKDARVFVESALKIAGVPELEARLEKVRLIHEEVKTYLPEESCADKSEAHAESRHDEDGIGGYICLDLPTGDSFCGYCESLEWPCDTVEALGGAE